MTNRIEKYIAGLEDINKPKTEDERVQLALRTAKILGQAIQQITGKDIYVKCSGCQAELAALIDYVVQASIKFSEDSGIPFKPIFCGALSVMIGALISELIAIQDLFPKLHQ